MTPIMLPGTNGATYPFWAPDSRSLFLTVKGKLQRAPLEGDARVVLGDSPGFIFSGAWLSAELSKLPRVVEVITTDFSPKLLQEQAPRVFKALNASTAKITRMPADFHQLHRPVADFRVGESIKDLGARAGMVKFHHYARIRGSLVKPGNGRGPEPPKLR